MKTKIITSLIILFTSLSAIAQVNKPVPVKDGTSYMKVTESYMQIIIPGIKDADPQTQYHIYATWKKSGVALKTIFWRGDGGWQNCSIMRAHKVKGKKGTTYTTETVKLDDIHKGDILEIVPMKGGKYPIPPEISKSTKNTVFFKTTTSGWLSLPVKKITKKADKVMP